jgi:phage baseplate assembly protein W
MDDVPHLALPLRLIGGSAYATVQQDTVEELTTTVAVICAFPLGSRPERPEFGITPPELADQPLDVAEIEYAVAAYEPRAVVAVTEVPGIAALEARVSVQVSMAREEEEEIA